MHQDGTDQAVLNMNSPDYPRALVGNTYHVMVSSGEKGL
jgi:hypothetical protein